MNKRPTAGSFREPLTAPLQEVSASNFADTSARTSLRRAIQRAEEIYKKEGKDKLLGYLAEKKLTGYAGFIKTHESEECYEFSKSKPRLFHKDESYKEREIYAHKMAFSDEKNRPKTVGVIDGIYSQFAFLDVQLSSEYKDSIIPILVPGKHDKFKTDDELRNLYFETVDLKNEDSIRESKYFRFAKYSRHECRDVTFATHDIERLLPYSTETPTRRPQGAPQKFPQSEVNNLLDQRYLVSDTLPKISEIISVLGAHYAETAKEPPAEKTIRRKAAAWLDLRKRSTAHSGT